jgi:ABC-2 type transport system permease protein
MWVLPDTNVLDYGYASMEPVFSMGPYVFLFLIPAITMRSFAEERRTGSIELLFTLPFRSWQIILGKYLAAFSLVLFSILPTLVYYFSLSGLGNPPGNLDSSGILGSYIGLILLGGVFVAIGIFSSAFTENQIIAFILAAFICFLAYEGFSALATLPIWGNQGYFVEQLGMGAHYEVLSKGLMDFRDLVYYLGSVTLFLLATHLILNIKR